MLDKLKRELVPAAGDKLVLKLSPPPPPLADKQASLAGNTTVNAAGGEAASLEDVIPSVIPSGEPASLEDVIPSEGKPVSLEYVGVVFAASVGASFAGAETSRRLTFTVDKTSCPPLPSPPLSVIDSAGGKHDGISSKSEPASLNDVIGNGNDVPSESAPTAPVGITSLSPSLLGAEACGVKDDVKAAPKPAVDTAKPDGDVDEIYLSLPPSQLRDMLSRSGASKTTGRKGGGGVTIRAAQEGCP